MLKINLLPVRQLKKRAKAKTQLVGMVFLLLLVLAALGGTGFLQAQKISGLKDKITKLENIVSSHQPTLDKIDKLKKDREELTRKTEIINNLKTDSSLTVRTLDEVANRIDSQRMWLDSLHQQTSSLSLTGVALDNQTIAQFMDKLKESPFIRDVTLASSSLKVVSGRNLKGFQLSCTVAQPGKELPKDTDVK